MQIYEIFFNYANILLFFLLFIRIFLILPPLANRFYENAYIL